MDALLVVPLVVVTEREVWAPTDPTFTTAGLNEHETPVGRGVAHESVMSDPKLEPDGNNPNMKLAVPPEATVAELETACGSEKSSPTPVRVIMSGLAFV